MEEQGGPPAPVVALTTPATDAAAASLVDRLRQAGPLVVVVSLPEGARPMTPPIAVAVVGELISVRRTGEDAAEAWKNRRRSSSDASGEA